MLRPLAAGLAIVAATASATAATPAQLSDEQQIRNLVQTELSAGATHDIDKVMSVYWKSNNFILYEAGPDIVYGYDRLKEIWLSYFKAFPKAEASIDGLHVGVSGDLGYAFSLQTWKFHKPDGSVRTDVHRVTSIYKKINGRWYSIHENDAIPSNINKDM